MPVADVTAIVGGHQVLVPAHLGDRAVDVADVARGVDFGEPAEGADPRIQVAYRRA